MRGTICDWMKCSYLTVSGIKLLVNTNKKFSIKTKQAAMNQQGSLEFNEPIFDRAITT